MNAPAQRPDTAVDLTRIDTAQTRLATTAQGCRTDDEALRIFLSAYQHASKHTLRAYAKETLRFLLWLRFNQPGDRLLPKVTAKTVTDYLDFVMHGGTIPPSYLDAVHWGKRRPPFSGNPLAAASRAHLLVILSQLFDSLANIEGDGGEPYCRFNPMRFGRAFGMRTLQTQFNPTERGLSFSAWRCVLQTIANPGGDAAKVRARWVILLLYYAFLRREEACRLRMGDFTASRAGWVLRVLGKGGLTKQIVAPSVLMDELAVYRLHLGLPPRPDAHDDTPVICGLGNHSPVSASTLYAICKDVFQSAADVAQGQGLLEDAQALRMATPHWLRHTGISHAMELGVEPRYVQAQARHSSLAITALYDHKDKDAWAASMEKLAGGAGRR